MTTDRGSQFFSRDWKAAIIFLVIYHIHTSAYHSQSNGLAERLLLFKNYSNNQKVIKNHVKRQQLVLVFAYNYASNSL